MKIPGCNLRSAVLENEYAFYTIKLIKSWHWCLNNYIEYFSFQVRNYYNKNLSHIAYVKIN